MRVKSQYLVRSVTFVLVLCVANVFAFAGVAADKSPLTSNVATAGILSVFDMDSALVNGNIARNGTTILSGSDIKVDKNAARIDLKGLGSIELAAGTSAKLSFTSGQINLNISNGQAQLTALKGVNGVLTTTEGEILKTDSSMEVSTVGNNAETVSEDGAKRVDDNDYRDANGKCIDANHNGKLECGRKPWAMWTNGEKAALFVGLVAVTTVIIYFATRNTSSTR